MLKTSATVNTIDPVKIAIFDMTGKQLDAIPVAQSGNQLTVDLTEAKVGIYLLQLTVDGQSITTRVQRL